MWQSHAEICRWLWLKYAGGFCFRYYLFACLFFVFLFLLFGEGEAHAVWRFREQLVGIKSFPSPLWVLGIGLRLSLLLPLQRSGENAHSAWFLKVNHKVPPKIYIMYLKHLPTKGIVG